LDLDDQDKKCGVYRAKFEKRKEDHGEDTWKGSDRIRMDDDTMIESKDGAPDQMIKTIR
jgi:hypothetical protein